tara:strand:- start:16 stop:483 length:468 start_codon:yes stop_codon:yes gene_type:complete
MPIIQLTFKKRINVSVQPGDLVYFSNPIPVGTSRSWPDVGGGTTTPHLKNDQEDIILIGPVQSINERIFEPLDPQTQQPTGEQQIFTDVLADMDQILFNQYFAQLRPQSFIMFSKDNKANMANMLGYYASVEYRNNSTDKAELFATGIEVHESSK